MRKTLFILACVEVLVRKAFLGTMIGATAVTSIGIAREAAADQTVPIGGVYTSGAAGSDWHDQQLFRDVSGNGISGDLYCVERSNKNNDNPGFDASSPSMPINIAPGSTIIIDDAYHQIIGGDQEGACALWFVPDGEDDPLWRNRIFNLADDGAENGLTIVASEPTYHEAGSTLSEMLSGDGMRDSAFLVSGRDGVKGKWVYKNGAGGNEFEVEQDLEPNKTFQWTSGVRQLLGFEPEAGAQLDYVVESGSANAYISRTNNLSNDGAFNEFAVTAQAKF